MLKIHLLLIIFWCSYPVLAQEEKSGEVLGEIIETNPQYPGGMEQFYVYMRDGEHPEIDGQLFISFFVETDGKISETTVVKGINEEVDQNIVELINSMPQWTPAMYKGAPVRKKVVLPIKI